MSHLLIAVSHIKHIFPMTCSVSGHPATLYSLQTDCFGTFGA
jgi:hypothetical protein